MIPIVKTFLERIEQAIVQYLPPQEKQPSVLHQAMQYSMGSGGKRLRPLLVLGTFDALGGNKRDPLPAAVAIECIHAYSLIHDDLPCMDNSDLRRGRPSCHKVFGEALALLAGDALLALAFEILASNGCEDLVSSLAAAAGSGALVGGQVQDILSEKDLILTPDTLQFIHAGKTAALLACATTMGAMLANAPVEVVTKAGKMGYAFGMAFQLFDDIQDATGSVEDLGKPVGQDVRHHKPSALRLYSVPEAKKRAQQYLQEAHDILYAISSSPASLESIMVSPF